MFYRYVGLRRKAIDLDNIFHGELVLVGGGPQHKQEIERLSDPRIVTMALNNTAVSFAPTLWCGLDGVENYSPSILMNPTFMKFTRQSRMGCLIAGTKWRAMPNTYFMPTRNEPNMKNFFLRGKWFGWWKSGFTGALQLAFRLGFRTVYTVGCGFTISKTDQYGFPSNLNDEQVAYNQRTYDMTIRQVRELLPLAIESNFEIVSCTPESKLNDFVRYRPFDEVFEELAAKVPPHDSVNVSHPKKPEPKPEPETKKATVVVSPDSPTKPRATVLMATFDRDELLKLGLTALSRQNAGPIEILVLNDGPHMESTKALATKYGATYVHTGSRITDENKDNPDMWRVPGFAYNIGAKMARSDILVLMCPEMWHMEETTLDRILGVVEEDPKRVGIPYGKYDDGSFLKAVQSDLSHADMSLYAKLKDLRTELPFLLAVSKKSYLDIGGYDEDFLGKSYDDDDFIDRLKAAGHTFTLTDAHCVHLWHDRNPLKNDKDRFAYNKKLYEERKGQIVRNADREWGVLK